MKLWPILLVAALALVAGCEGTTDPLVGWKPVAPISYKSGEMSATVDTLPGCKTITDDVQNFVNDLPVYHGPNYDPVTRRYCYWIQQITLFEDGTGQRGICSKFASKAGTSFFTSFAPTRFDILLSSSISDFLQDIWHS